MDVFSETLIKRKFNKQDRKKIKILFATLLICSVVFILGIPAIALMIRMGGIITASLIAYAIIIFVI